MMDAVGFNYPVDVSKLRVTKDSEPVVTTSIQSCSNSHRHQDGTSSVNGLESALLHKIPDAELSGHAVQQSRFQGEELSERHDSKGTGCHSAPGAEFVRVRRKAGRVSRCSNGSSKRSRVAPPEDTANSAGVDDVKGVTDKSGSSPTKCNPPEKIQPAKQRHNFGGKRGERRNFKMSMKPKYEIFSLKSGFASFGGGVGGNNFFGAYGLKSDVQDITKFVDDVSLNELLDGTHECTSFGKEKGKKAAVMNGNFLDSVRKAWPVVPPQKAVQHQNISEIDNFRSKKFPNYPSSPVSLASHVVNCDKEDCCPDDLSSSNKIQDSCGKPEMPATLLDFPLRQPKDVLEHLMLPPPKDLESLLLDAAKPSSSSRNTSDLRSGKQISRRPSLPPFPWSHSSNGHCRTNSDAVKCLTSRTTCQGRWVKIAKAASSPGSGTYSFTDLESLTYDQSLVPLRSKSGGLDNRIFPSTSSLPFGEWGSPSVAIDSRASQVPIESGSELKDQVNDAQCPRLLAAAQTLCDIATNPLRKNLNGFLRWPKKTPQKTMKACKSRLIEKSEEKYSTSLVSGSVKLVRSDVEHIMPLKRPKLSTAENKKGLSHTTCVRRGTMPSPTPKASRSSPGKSVRESILEVRHSPPTLVKQPCIMHLSAKQSA